MKESAETFKEEYDLDLFMETSAKTGMNAQELFVQAGKLLYKEYSKFKKRPKKTGETLKNEGETNEKKKKCC